MLNKKICMKEEGKAAQNVRHKIGNEESALKKQTVDC